MTEGLFEREPEGLTIPRLHQSLAHLLVSKSPLHCWHKAFSGEPEEETEATDRGTIAHALLLGGKDIVACEAPDWRTKAAREFRDEAKKNGKLPILAHKLASAKALRNIVMENLSLRGICLEGQSEVTAIWRSPGGALCQGRMDHFILRTATIYDFKFVRSANPATAGRSMIDFGYHIQDAAYRQSVETIYPELAGRVKFIFVFIEPEPPNAITLIRSSGMMRQLGESQWARGCDMWQECLETYGSETPWPGYSTDIVDVDPPAYAMQADVNSYIEADIKEASNGDRN